jgi:hypothetical protein
MLKCRGQWVSPVEVEAALIAHPAVLECAVVGKIGDDGLVRPHVFVALRAGARRPEDGTLHRVVRENLLTLYAAAEDGFDGTPLPAFVRKELEGYLDCGLLCRGFAVLACQSCPERRLVAYSCKSRAFCPSCLGRRMAQTTLNLLDHVLPRGVALRQFVLTMPFALRQRLAYHGKLLGAVGRIFVDSVLRWYRRRMADADTQGGRSGAFTVVQRTSSDLKLNPHLHAVFLDGVFVLNGEGRPVFHPLPRLSTSEVADLLQVVRVRVLRYLEQQGVVQTGADVTVLDDDLAQREPALAQLAAAAVAGLPPAGPDLRRRPCAIPLPGRPGVEVMAPLSVTELGFSLHAATRAGAHDERARATLVKYVLRPPIAEERLRLLPDDWVRIQLRRPFRDGTYAVDMDPLSLLCRLAAAVPPPRFHTVRYAGVLASASSWRALVVPPPPPPPPPIPRTSDDHPTCAPTASPTHRSRYRPWLELLKRTFAIDLEMCPRCGGHMKILALVNSPASIERFLRHLGEPTEPPPLEPARAPPYYRSPTLRHRLSAPPAQAELFDT